MYASARLLAPAQAATPAIDLSDGLADGLTHGCGASGLGVEIQAAALPMHPDTVTAAGRGPRSRA